MDIPEEEVEQAIIWDLKILKIRSSGKLHLIKRQRTLSTADGFIDLFLKDDKRYYIVELKREYLKNKSIVTDQILRYRNSFKVLCCQELTSVQIFCKFLCLKSPWTEVSPNSYIA